jgi:glucokinase/N-acetylglucosamine kinase
MILGVDVGGTNIDIVVFEKNFSHIATYPTKDYVVKLDNLLNELAERYQAKAVGIGFAGWIKRGKIIKAPNIRLNDFKLELDVPYVLDNDANCFALYASHVFGFKNLIGVTIGTGIGSGIVVDGKVYRGMGLAGEIGHWFVGGDEVCTCGGRGHLECYFGGWSFKKRGLSAVELVESGRIYELEDFEKLCICIANAIALLDPEAVVFGGRIGGSLYERTLKERIYRYLMPEFRPEIKTLNDPLAVAKGACLMVME